MDDRKIPVKLLGENETGFTVDLRRAVGMENVLTSHLHFGGLNKKGEPERQCWGYHIIMWQHHSPAPESVLNIPTDFYFEYHRHFLDRPVNWKFVETRERHKKDHTANEPLQRRPSLSDPAWFATIRDRLVETARFHAPYRPLSDSLGAERGIAPLAASWDFDFADESLVPMRCLRERYGGLGASNEQWGELGIRFTGATTASIHVLDVVNPSGQIVGYYSGNLLASEGRAGRLIPFALNDPPAWRVE